jgi:hypothetical protein
MSVAVDKVSSCVSWVGGKTVSTANLFAVTQTSVTDEFSGIDLIGETASPSEAMMSIKRLNVSGGSRRIRSQQFLAAATLTVSLADFTRFEMPIFFFQFEVRPKRTHPKRDQYGGAMVNCWILRDTQSQAEAVARCWIGDDDWRVTRIEQATEMTREQQAEYPEGMEYFEQAENDGEVFVFHTWPLEAPDDENVG